jgi:hypothetical protein
MFIGTRLNESEDAVDFRDYSDRWINLFMTRDRSPLSPEVHEEMVRDLRATAEGHLLSLDGTSTLWGWKEPRSIYLLPFFHSQYPNVKFLHVVRDGRDMAFSWNQNQLRKHGQTLLTAGEMLWDDPFKSIALWARINLMVAEYGRQFLGDRYLRIRFEDLCGRPVFTVRQILDFFNLRGDPEKIARLEIKPPASLGRWKETDEDTLAKLGSIGREALEMFAYSEEKPPMIARALEIGTGNASHPSSKEVICVLGMHRSGTSLISIVAKVMAIL